MTYTSSTVRVPDVAAVPRHVAIIMDGNGRWATQRRLPRVAGHSRGVDAVRATVEACARAGVEYLTLFAFSSENWRRPVEEVSFLMRLFVTALEREVGKLHANGIRLRVVGDLSQFDTRIQDLIRRAETKTARNERLTLTIAANYGGRWDILQAARKAAEEAAQEGQPANFDEEAFSRHLAMAYAPEPDLFIRTGGETRISNFLLWQLAYTELYFTETFWPDFDANTLADAIASYGRRERRFGRTSAQLEPQSQDVDSLPC
ncbi:di-trans,poly-cis-decaprenylcistransferase [Paraburkholderia sp. NMBU_R16]|uniref:polyprenyl diphosphate synthase n=1 Tax=Paraburkholderia sp. NMBU_R16 TaxID=2698676 RepID=UPI0015640EC1|nr:polyprenyl diphosphate synthase [Paraburkholderia sp. NMBU_R16]NRO97731.1 di-trans,poly-cis-decaprenylcistransferase [Paraburkholderia sp. NMBU_R16]